MPSGYKHNMKIRKLNNELRTKYENENIEPTHKWCKVCEQLLPIEQFNAADSMFGRSVQCRECQANYKKQYIENNRENVKKAQAEKYQKNKEKYIIKNKEYAEKYKPIRNAKQRQKYRTDENFRIKHNLRKSLYQFMNGTKSKKSSEYGIDWDACIAHLGPRPNETEKWHIDHIIPCAVFDFLNPDHILLCYNPNNLRWLTESENAAKKDKVIPSLISSYNLNWIADKMNLDIELYTEEGELKVIA